MSRLQQFLYGVRDSIAMIVGILPFGLIYGALASLAGLSLGQALGMSMLVYAGSAQFIAISLLTLGSGAVVILLTTLVVNLRHVLYSAALQPYVGGLPQRWRVPLAFGLTDETFAVNLGRFAQKTWSPSQALCLNMICYVAWALSTVAGCYIGEVIKIDTALVGYALTAMFIGLWSFYLGKINMIIVGFLAGGLALVFSQMVGYKLHIVLAAIIAATIGCLFENWATRRARP